MCSASNTVTSQPSFASSPAHVSDAGPEPTTATRLPERSIDAAASSPAVCSTSPSPSHANSSIAAAASSGCSNAQSDVKRSRRPIETGSPFFPRVHTPSHCVSCGHTRPQMAGSEFALFTMAYARAKLPSATCAINCGMGTPTGQPPTHGAFGHWMQRRASATASSSE